MLPPLPAGLVRNFSYPLHRIRYGVDASGAARQLREQQWWSPGELGEWQDRRLRELVQHCARHIPYYRELFAEHGVDPARFRGREDLGQIPTLSKEQIRANEAALVWPAAGRRDLRRNSTGGSTGANLYFFQDRACRAGILGTQVVNFEWLGAEFGEPVAYLWGSPIETRRSRALVGRLKNALQNTLYLSCFGLDSTMVEDYEQRLRDWGPRILIGYPSALSMFARELERRGRPPIPLGGIICTSEVLLPSERELIERAFGTSVFNRYGCREVGDIAHECDAHEGMHVNAGRMVVELGDPGEGGEGDLGEVIVTDLDNHSMPFLRYRMGDLAAWLDGSCPCGRGLPRLREVAGRKFDLVRAPSGAVLPGTFWTHLFRSIPGVAAFQVRQVAADRLRILLVPEPAGLGDDALDWFANEIERIAGEGLRADFERVATIPPHPSGKRRFVVNEVGD